MSSRPHGPTGTDGQTLATLLKLSHSARCATEASVLHFLAVNDTHDLVPYRQAALWLDDSGVAALSGVVQIEANAPYVQWLDSVCHHLSSSMSAPCRVTAAQLPPEVANGWDAWLPAFGLWLPLMADNDGARRWGGLLLVRDTPWQDVDISVVSEWAEIWCYAFKARTASAPGPWWQAWWLSTRSDGPWWKGRRIRWAVGIATALLIPVRLTVLAPGELVPTDPSVIRAPLEGVVGSFSVKPNDIVKAGQPLFDFDDAPLKSKLDVTQQALSTAEAEYRQAAQLAVSDPKYKGQIALLMGKVEERRAEAEYMQGLLERSHVLAPQDGVVLFDDPSEWIGKPVNIGERIMRIATPGAVEIEAWLALGDAIPFEEGASVSLYLNASPLHAVPARIRYVAYEAVLRPDGNYAYRVRATLDGKTDHRVGLKGTAKLSGRWVPLGYWLGRRPLAAVRQVIGW